MNIKYWVVLICCCMFVGGSVGATNSFGVFTLPLAYQMNCLRGTVALGQTICIIVGGIAAPIFNKTLKRYKLKFVVLLTALAQALISISFGFIQSVALYLLLSLIKGIISVFFSTTIAIIVIGNWFKDNKNTYTAIALGMSGLFGAIISPVLTNIITNYGTKIGFFAYAFCQLILTLPLAFFVKFKPDEENCTPYVSNLSENKKIIKQNNGNYPFKTNDPIFVIVCIISIFTTIPITCMSHYMGFAESINLINMGSIMISATNIANLFFKYVTGFICDRFGNDKGVPFACITSIIGCLILIFFYKIKFMLIIGAFLLGCIFSTQVITSAFIRYIYGDEQYSAVFNAQLVFYGLYGLANTIFGYLYDFTKSYIPIFILCCVVLIISLVVYVYAIDKTAKYRK